MVQMISTIGLGGINQMTGVSVTNMNIAKNLLEKAAELLGSEVRHYTVVDRTTEHEKFVIEYNHSDKK
jgi:hypothetical protein|tara:strand:+ start:2480 stop:2683 length:204 start_codon:yes stop_codon:yes gene_type:complete